MSETIEVRKIALETNPVQLEADLDALKAKALELGATDASVISTEQLVFAEYVPVTVSNSRYRSRYWPFVLPNDSVKDAILAFKYGVFYRIRNDQGILDCFDEPIHDPLHINVYQKIYEIASKVESMAFYMGYYLAMGFASGNCRSVFCSNEKVCQALAKGQSCRHPYISRPSLEAVGLDVRSISHNLGWMGVPDSNFSCLSGLVLVS